VPPENKKGVTAPAWEQQRLGSPNNAISALIINDHSLIKNRPRRRMRLYISWTQNFRSETDTKSIAAYFLCLGPLSLLETEIKGFGFSRADSHILGHRSQLLMPRLNHIGSCWQSLNLELAAVSTHGKKWMINNADV
jgi:hypothetical protein